MFPNWSTYTAGSYPLPGYGVTWTGGPNVVAAKAVEKMQKRSTAIASGARPRAVKRFMGNDPFRM